MVFVSEDSLQRSMAGVHLLGTSVATETRNGWASSCPLSWHSHVPQPALQEVSNQIKHSGGGSWALICLLLSKCILLLDGDAVVMRNSHFVWGMAWMSNWNPEEKGLSRSSPLALAFLPFWQAPSLMCFKFGSHFAGVQLLTFESGRTRN